MSLLESLKIEETINTPSIYFDTENNVFKISGKSMPEDAHEFYHPILEWVDKFVESPIANAKFEVTLEYFNTASSKHILSIIKKIGKSSKGISIDWHYMEDDEDMLDVGEHLAEILGEGIVNIILDED